MLKPLTVIVLAICCTSLATKTIARETGNSANKPKRPIAVKKQIPDSDESRAEVTEEKSPDATLDRSEAAEHSDQNSSATTPAPARSPSASWQQTTPSEDWEIYVTPYAFLPRLDGTVGIIPETAQVNARFSDIFRDLKFALMGTFEARKRNWFVLVDGIYVSLESTRVTPSPFFSDINVEVKETIITPEVGYRVANYENGSIDIMAGARIWHVKTHINFERTILPPVDVEGSKTWVDPIVGARGTVKVSPRVFLNGEFDAGGFGIASDFTGQVYGGAGFQWKPRVAFLGGYRYLRVDYTNDRFLFKTALSGVVIGAKFRL